MFLTGSKIEARIREIAGYRYRDSIAIPGFRMIVDEAGEIAAKPPGAGEGSTIMTGERWKGRDLYVWLTASVDIPAAWSGRKVLGRFDFGNTGGGNNSGFESLLYLNGQPYQGVDSNHKEVFLPEAAAGGALAFDFRLWSGLEGGGHPADQEHEIKLAEVCWLDETIDDLYYTAWAAYDTTRVLDANDPNRVQLTSALDKMLRLIDWSRPGSEAFYESLYAAHADLNERLAAMEKHHNVTVQCIGHTHIDVAWLWRLKHTREKCARSFSTVLRLMEQFPEYVFLQTQPQLYEYVKNDYPELYEKIRERVAEGRWEAGGGMWLEADCNLTSGESLVRQLLVGTRFLRNEFGVECRYLWLPDVFGYSWALPQILQKSGIGTFMTTKISWNQYNRMPHDTFRWRGIDGTEVMTHFITTPEPWSQPGSWFYTYNGQITAKTVKGIWDGYRDKEINQELLLSYGYGDGGGGVNREMLEMRRRFDRMPGMPHVKTGTADTFFQGLQERVADTDSYVHTWDGELYLEYHRGTYTSQAYNKLMNRKLELLYRETEWLGSLQAVLNGSWAGYRQSELTEGWKIILRNQFHDIIPGSSIREVYEDSTIEYAEAEAIGKDVWTAAASGLVSGAAGAESGAEQSFTVLNSASWERGDLVRIDATAGMESGAWLDANGNELRAQRSGDSWLVADAGVPSLGLTTLTFRTGAAGSAGTTAFAPHASGIKTPHYEIEWNGNGQLTRVYDIESGREVLASGERGNVLQVFEDKPLAHDAWDIDLFYQEKMEEVTALQSAEVIENGALRAVVRFHYTYKDSTITQDMTVYADSRRIDFRTEADWHERRRLLKAAFPVDIRATEATYDIQFGNVKRPTHWNTSWDYARFETVGHQWADLSERGYGVSLLNDCKYGYDIKDNVMRLSLIKSAVYPDIEADQGHHQFTYSLLPHRGDWHEGGTVREAWELNNPLTHVRGALNGDSKTLSLFAISSANVVVDAVKKAEDENTLVLRVHEFAGGREKVVVTSDLAIESWTACNLLEQPIGDKTASDRLEFTINPYEILTFLIDLKK